MMYFSSFKKYSKGRELYGVGFVINHKYRTFVIGFKRSRSRWGIINLKTKNQRLCIISIGICIIHITIRTNKKDFKQYAHKLWGSKKHFISLINKKDE